MPDITAVRPGAEDLLAQLGTGQVHTAARARGVTFPAYLEEMLPTPEQPDGLDGFGRLLRAANIRTRDVPARGIYSDRVEAFAKDENTRVLFAEWVARRFREASGGLVQTRAGGMYTSSDGGVGSALQPIIYDAQARFKQIAPAVPIAEVVAMTTGIDGNTYEAFYLTDVTDDERMKRVVEGTDIPMAKLSGGDHTIRLRKFGRGLQVSYEKLRRQRIDQLALHIARMAIQAEVDKLAAIMDIMVNGDGNASTAATNYNLTALDTTATAGHLTLAAWLAFKAKFVNPYTLTTVLAREATVIQLQTLNTGSANIPLVAVQAAQGLGTVTPINAELGDNVRLGLTADAPANVLIGFDRRFAVERLVENGSEIQETERWIRNQTEVLFMTVNEGYDVFDANATKTLTVNA